MQHQTIGDHAVALIRKHRQTNGQQTTGRGHVSLCWLAQELEREFEEKVVLAALEDMRRKQILYMTVRVRSYHFGTDGRSITQYQRWTVFRPLELPLSVFKGHWGVWAIEAITRRPLFHTDWRDSNVPQIIPRNQPDLRHYRVPEEFVFDPLNRDRVIYALGMRAFVATDGVGTTVSKDLGRAPHTF